MAKILYIEDNLTNRLLVKRILMVEDHEVVEAENGTQGIEMAQKELPDLILVDINMPDMDGYEVTAYLRKIQALDRVPIVALTANVLRGDRERSLEAGCDGYIQKPLDVDMLPSQVEAFDLSYCIFGRNSRLNDAVPFSRGSLGGGDGYAFWVYQIDFPEPERKRHAGRNESRGKRIGARAKDESQSRHADLSFDRCCNPGGESQESGCPNPIARGICPDAQRHCVRPILPAGSQQRHCH